MKVIDLLNKIANGEEVPKKIRDIDEIWKYDEEVKDYFHDDLWLFYSMNSIGLLEREVEIIEDKTKENKMIKKIEDKARFQYSEIPSWFDIKEVIRVINSNFERHQKALSEIIDKINGE